eukprot:g1823.t1
MEPSEELHDEGEKTPSATDWLNGLYAATQEDCMEHIEDRNHIVSASEGILLSSVHLHKNSINEDRIEGASRVLRSGVEDVGSFASMVHEESDADLFNCQGIKETETSSSPRFEHINTGHLQSYLSERNTTATLETPEAPHSCSFINNLVTSSTDHLYRVPEATQQLTNAFLETMDAAATAAPALVQVPKTRWRPNHQQLTILERHFDSGYTKSTPELIAIVKSTGEANEAQISVWLKNRLARSKKRPSSSKNHCLPALVGAVNTQNPNIIQNDSYLASAKRYKRSEDQFQEQCFAEFEDVSKVVLAEVTSSLFSVSPVNVSLLVSEITNRQRVCCYGVGRELCVMRALVIRLHQLGVEAYLVGELNTPEVGSDDVLIASAGPGFYNTVSAICLAAIRAKAHVIVITYHQTAPVPFADTVIRIPSASEFSGQHTVQVNNHHNHRSYGTETNGSVLSLGAAGYESTLWMLFECVCLILQRKKGVTETHMLKKTTNLEQ